MSRRTLIFKIIVPIIILIAGALIMTTLLFSRSEPKKEARQSPGVLVRVIEVKAQDKEIVVKGTGTVRAAHEIAVTPQVSGRITYSSLNMVEGGFFRKDELLFEVEDTDYKLALERAMGARAGAEFELAIIESKARIARSEWERLNIDGQPDPNPLVLYEPQMKNARAALASAEAMVEQARLDLERTKIKAPFNGRISSESIDFGQYIRSGNTAAVLSGTDTAEVIVPLPLDELQWLSVPRYTGGTNGNPAVVTFTTGAEKHQWQGRIIRSTGEVDPKTRMVQLIIEIEDPYGLRAQNRKPGPALATGTFVDVNIQGRKLQGVFTIPRTAYRDNKTVWLLDADNTLRIREVAAVHFDTDSIVISKGLHNGDRIIMTNISGAAGGMKLRAAE